MVDFGYSTLISKIHDLDKADLSLANEIIKIEPSFNLCISCGSCAATCTAARFTNFNFREMCHRIRRGETSIAVIESEKCMLCGKCTLACPRNVNTRNIIHLVRRAF